MTVIPFNPDDEGDKYFLQVSELAGNFRGRFIEQAIGIERLTEDIIATAFCKDEYRRRLFFSLVLNDAELTFSRKTIIFKKLLELAYPKLLQEHPKLIDSIDKIRRLRNRLAHSMLDKSDAYLSKRLTDQIQLCFFEDGQEKTQVITSKEMRQRLADSTSVILELVNIQEKIKDESVAG